ncbi:MAG TPA: c-type cytochrome domain-containing protein, partial [Planctomycetota bacterium]|nr:c-type cytochrome domain-containing protein [Planctomycetota bacterium]
MVTVLWALLSLQSTGESDADFFERKIRPLLAERCFSCHSRSANKHKGGLRLDTRADLLRGGDSGSAAAPGDPQQSLLVRAVRYGDDLKMPPQGKLSDSSVADLSAWIRRGLPWPAEAEGSGPVASTAKPRPIPWSFQPLRKPAVPPETDEWRLTNVIDRFILEKLREQGLQPAPPAGRDELLRRV